MWKPRRPPLPLYLLVSFAFFSFVIEYREQKPEFLMLFSDCLGERVQCLRFTSTSCLNLMLEFNFYASYLIIWDFQ